jgi:hypothetical protein
MSNFWLPQNGVGHERLDNRGELKVSDVHSRANLVHAPMLRWEQTAPAAGTVLADSGALANNPFPVLPEHPVKYREESMRFAKLLEQEFSVDR